ncbi:LytR/AlgR family response regulator transcription factor [Aureitalea marina]|uniref:DNA-binding response regulator n=1 Tax=Aureitalea marina TaxID=930804 RepID=A0A2S7KR73_9FLAO|nr:LytTR family DNA-binding domain-containing protein [Aureitalea marina]PQB05125.1 DNA-binding response regulator [Aureitalea marina]
MMLKTIIVEDEATSREILKGYLGKYCPQVEILGEAENVEQALQLIRGTSPDLVFLDVEMPYGNAFDLLDQVGERSFETIFVTAYDQYAIDALNAHAAYYLLKPISIDKLIEAVDYVKAIRQKEAELAEKVLKPKSEVTSGKMTIPVQSGFEVLEIGDILYCQADDNYTHIFTTDRKKLVSKTLKYFEDALNGNGFVRVHKSYLVNVGAITQYRKGKGGSVVLNNGKEIMVSPARKKELLSYFE